MKWLPRDWDADAEEAKLRESDSVKARKIHGEDLELESVANSILARGRRGTTKLSELRDYLSPSQLNLRRSREVYPTQGFPEVSFFSGLYKRAYNPKTRGEHSSNSVPGFEDGPTWDQGSA